MLLQIDSKQEVKWATVLFTPDTDDILYCSAGEGQEFICHLLLDKNVQLLAKAKSAGY